MKYINKIALACSMIVLLMTSCTDETPLEFTGFTKPYSIEDMEYLNTFDDLKTYIDRAANPNFKLGAVTALSDFTGKSTMYRMLISNFDQISLNNEMMHRTVVDVAGGYNFGSLAALVATANDSETSIFGRSLVWHSQQRGEFFYGTRGNDGKITYQGVIMDEEIIDFVLVPGEDDSGEKLVNGDFSEDTWNTSFRVQNGGTTGALTGNGQGPGGQGRALAVTNPAVQSQGYGSQFLVVWDTPMQTGDTWTFKMDYKSDVECSYGNQAQSSPGNYMHNDLVDRMNSKTSWQTYEKTWVIEARSNNCKTIAFDLGLTATNYYFANVSLYKHPIETEMVTNGDFSDDTWNTSFRVQNGGTTGALTGNGQGPGGQGRALVVTNPAVQSQSYGSQFLIVWDEPMQTGDTWRFKMDYKSDDACRYGNQAQSSPGNYMHGGLLADMESTSSWQTYEKEWVIEARSNNCKTIAFDLGLTATNYYFANISLIKIGGSQDKWVEQVTIIPKTDAEKFEIVSEQLERWIKNVMDVTGESVKDWEVVNEPMDDSNPTQLRTAPANPDNDFYWQDYLGKDYARMAVRLAREHGGEGLKLFVNDTRLTNTDKCDGLITMIKYWESDNTTKIDGISAQLNELIYSLEPQKQKANEDAIVALFTKLKNSGKLIRITQLDMRIADELGLVINTVNVPRDYQLAMSKYYNFIIRKYFEIIPAAQRYGITVNPIETTTNSGLWRGDYSRKFTYSGVADGLAGRDVNRD